MKKHSKLIILTFFALALSGVTFAQGTTSRLTGTVKDNNGAVVAGANVTLTNEGTNISITTQTSDDGSYTFDLIQIGSYSVTVEKAGFKKFVSKNGSTDILMVDVNSNHFGVRMFACDLTSNPKC